MDATAPTDLDAIDILKLLEYLPHRYPFLLVDRIKAERGAVRDARRRFGPAWDEASARSVRRWLA